MKKYICKLLLLLVLNQNQICFKQSRRRIDYSCFKYLQCNAIFLILIVVREIFFFMDDGLSDNLLLFSAVRSEKPSPSCKEI